MIVANKVFVLIKTFYLNLNFFGLIVFEKKLLVLSFQKYFIQKLNTFLFYMNLSHLLFSAIFNKLKLNVSLLNEEKFFIKNVKNQIDLLKKIKEKDYKNLSIKKTRLNSKNSQNLIVIYIINISFLKTNTIINISDIKGNVKLFYSAGLVDLVGKQKKKRRIAILKLISLLLKKATFLYRNPIALHLNKVSFYKKFIVTKLKKMLYLRVIKIFNQTSYNGCRKKKLPRKKFTKKFK